MKLRKLGRFTVVILGIVLALGAVCGAFFYNDARPASARYQLSAIVVHKAPDVTNPVPGQRVTFVLTVSIPGGTPYMDIPVLITETLPHYVEFLDATAPYTRVENTLNWAGVLRAGVEPAVVTFSVRVAPTATAYLPIVNQDYAAATRWEVVKGDPVTLTVAGRPGVTLQPVLLSPAVFFGSQVQIPYWITNTGDLSATFTLTTALNAVTSLAGWEAAPPLPVTLVARAGQLITVTVTAGRPASRPHTPITARLMLTATSPLTATYNADVVVTARYAWVYLPLVLRDYPPTPVITAFNLVPWRGNQEQKYAYSAAVTAMLAASVQNDVLQQVCFGTTAQSMTDCYPFAVAVPYTLPSGSGYHTVYAQVKGAHGGVSAPAMAVVFLLENGDFADGTAHWDLMQSDLPVAVTAGRALLGNAALTCQPIPLGEAAVAQAVDLQAVPAGKTITLYFDYEIVTEDKFIGSDYDRFMVLINGEEKHRDGYQGSETFGCGKWHTIRQTDFALDLTSYRGQSVSLRLANTTRFDEWYNTYTYVDNVRVVVTP